MDRLSWLPRFEMRSRFGDREDGIALRRQLGAIRYPGSLVPAGRGEVATGAEGGVATEFDQPSPPAIRPVRSVRRAVLVGFAAYLVLGVGACWGISHLLPDNMSFSLLGHTMSVDDLQHRIFIRLLMCVGIIPAIFAIELSLVDWSESSLHHLIRHPPSSMTDLACFLCLETRILNTLGVVMSFGFILISSVWLHGLLSQVTGYSPSIAWMPAPFQFMIFFFVYSFVDYWNHRADHSTYFWPLHRFHHAADEFCIFNSVRVHPAGLITIVIFTILPAALLNAAPRVMVDVGLSIAVLRYVIHSRINSNWGWIGRWVLQSPVHHRLHHILDTTEPTGHFSLVPLWDRMFGTWRGDTDQSLAIGVATPYRHGLWMIPDLWRDYLDFVKGLTRIFAIGRS
jgi:sterol desaturase/sphingolipid hydroxylase (fatty acid hydroxylase superfamily)